MDGGMSCADDPSPPFPLPPSPSPPAASFDRENQEKEEGNGQLDETDYPNLPCPLPYEELQIEAYTCLTPDLFEGFRFDYTKQLSKEFSLHHRVFMGMCDVPCDEANIQAIKYNAALYTFSAKYQNPRCTLVGRAVNDERNVSWIDYNITENFSIKADAMTTHVPHLSFANFRFDYKTISPNVSLGGEVFKYHHQRKVGIGCAARYASDHCIGTFHVVSNGLLSMNYLQKVSNKISLATQFYWDLNLREAFCSIGYEYLFPKCRLRSKIDSNGCVATYLEEKLFPGVNLILSAEVDHWRKSHRFGFGMSVGELF
ncbi:hypothetical protein KP509_20G062200 [Ceratopteris richardii]|uniref:Mitochondrial import receptor subunit TOM40-1 n=1 Tax=Ceratopteris richardii TaxID=49495 RepID=A0A8T2SJ56_CERRI|nr:hypothetical protein KP509_20G062200 [Ceratopteris richardii]KAH7331988.1 hypothetical protein KP509_20G062200 [Ceratopteris richardii]